MKISIVTATRNCAATLAGCLSSVHRQTYPHREQVIIDGASTDSTLEVIARFRDAGSGSMVVVSEPDGGIYDAMNKGIGLATGEVIGFLNADDSYADAEVLSRVAALFRDPAVMSCYGDLVYVNETTVVRYWKAGGYSPGKFSWGWMPPHPTFFVRRSVYERYGRFRLDLGSAADYELMLRFLLRNRISTAYIPHVLVAMRVGGASNASLGNRLRANRMDRRAWTVNALTPLPWTTLMKPLRKLSQWFIRGPCHDR